MRRNFISDGPDLEKDPWEKSDINDFVFHPNPEQPWDVKIEAKSEVWKKGRPG